MWLIGKKKTCMNSVYGEKEMTLYRHTACSNDVTVNLAANTQPLK